MATSDMRFPLYSPAERRFDQIVHLIGVPAGMIAASWLLVEVCRTASPPLIASMAVYAVGLIGMLSASAAYNLAPPGRTKEGLRRADHAMIFVMIAGSYTPFAMNALPPPEGVLLCVFIWTVAVAGIGLQLIFPRRFERVSLALYLGMGWAIVLVIRPLVEHLPPESLALLVAGGLVYSLGALVHTRDRLKFHNAIWHVLVLVAAGLHVVALYSAFLSA